MTDRDRQIRGLLAGVNWATFSVNAAGRIRTAEQWCPLMVWHGGCDGYIGAAQTALRSSQMVYDIMAAADWDGRARYWGEPNYRSSRDLRRWMLARMRAAKRRRTG